ncbi:MAG: VUT family protein [Comamonadaceae bacterium]|nr:MAG: VUT family protein [Comamonadaceae bacterium]
MSTPRTPLATPTATGFGLVIMAMASMAAVVLASNILVQYAINDWLTWGAFTYPVAFLVSELVNRRFGPGLARRVAWVGFAVAVLASLWLAPARIAIASGAAFIASQLLDIRVFDRLRQGVWWRAPLVATLAAAVLDSAVFWGIGFAGTGGPWLTWALGDLAVKLLVGAAMLLPFRLLIARSLARQAPLGSSPQS